MILDKIENLSKYPEFENVKKFLEQHSDNQLKIGKYIVDENCFVNVSEYYTDNGKRMFEGHQRYIDFQLIISGKEYFHIQDIKQCELVLKYDKDKDVAFYNSKKWDKFYLEKGFFIVLFDNDIHRPCVFVDEPEKVRKFVFKIKK